jgi:hypothetical protein
LELIHGKERALVTVDSLSSGINIAYSFPAFPGCHVVHVIRQLPSVQPKFRSSSISKLTGCALIACTPQVNRDIWITAMALTSMSDEYLETRARWQTQLKHAASQR